MKTPTTKPNTQIRETTKGSVYLIGIPFLTGLAIALFSPIDVLQYGVPRAFAQIASFIFPTVRKMSEDHELGQVAKLYFSTMWLMVPAIFLYCYKDLNAQAYKVIPKCRENKFFTFIFFGVFCPLAAIALAILNLESNDIDSVRVFLTFHSRWGMSLWGFVMPAGAAASCAFTAFYFSNIRNIFD